MGSEDPLEKEMVSYLLGESHGLRSLPSYSPWGCKDLDTTKQLNNKILTSNLEFTKS